MGRLPALELDEAERSELKIRNLTLVSLTPSESSRTS